MAIAASGVVSAADIRTEFGFSGTVSFADLYRGGSHIRAKAANNNGTNLAASVPTSGTITFDNFRGTAKAFRYTYTAGATNQNASTLFGDDYAVNYPKEIVINSGVELGATSVTQEALQIDSGGSGLITVTNNGTLSGAGAAFLGSVGGDAFEADISCTLINNGTIRSGGGTGGSGGQGSYTSQSTAGPYGSLSHNYWRTWSQGVQIKYGGSLIYWGTSAGTANAAGYSKGSLFYNGGENGLYYRIYKTTTSTSYTNGGYGGAGEGYNQSAGSGTSGGQNAGQGGTGGSFGQTGATGANGNYGQGTAGNAAGKSIKGISFVTLTDNGTLLGGTA